MERKVGEVFTCEGKTYQVVESAGCAKCAFTIGTCGNCQTFLGHCLGAK